MYPILLIGPVAVPTYPLLLLLAFWAGMWLSARRAKQLGLNGDHVYNAGLYGFLAGIIGARLWFVLAHWENYATNIVQVFSLSRSALSAGEGAIIGGVVVLIYLLRNRVSLGLFFDAAAPGLALALTIGHIGAFLGGAALGAPANLPWAIEIAGMARHPSQLYEAIASLGILGILYLLRQWRPWLGFHFWLFVLLYSASRLLLEIFRARPYLVGEHYLAAQIIALGAIVVALTIMAYNFNSDAQEVLLENQ